MFCFVKTKLCHSFLNVIRRANTEQPYNFKEKLLLLFCSTNPSTYKMYLFCFFFCVFFFQLSKNLIEVRENRNMMSGKQGIYAVRVVNVAVTVTQKTISKNVVRTIKFFLYWTETSGKNDALQFFCSHRTARQIPQGQLFQRRGFQQLALHLQCGQRTINTRRSRKGKKRNKQKKTCVLQQPAQPQDGDGRYVVFQRTWNIFVAWLLYSKRSRSRQQFHVAHAELFQA